MTDQILDPEERKRLGMVPIDTIWEATREDGSVEYINTDGAVVGRLAPGVKEQIACLFTQKETPLG